MFSQVSKIFSILYQHELAQKGILIQLNISVDRNEFQIHPYEIRDGRPWMMDIKRREEYLTSLSDKRMIPTDNFF